jgi:hypothetical protein
MLKNKIMQIKFFLDSQLWKLKGNVLLNKEGLWTSADMWNFKTNLISNDSEPVKGKENWIYIENKSKAKFLGTAKYGSKVILDKAAQVWKQGVPNTEGYFIVENFKAVQGKVITAISSSGLEIRGNILYLTNSSLFTMLSFFI